MADRGAPVRYSTCLHLATTSPSVRLGMPASTIRFYEKNGLIPNQRRSSDGRRLFDEDGLEWLRFVERLKTSGMPIKEIREYIELYLAGDATIEARRRIVYERRRAMPFDELPERIQRIKRKCRINRY